MKKIDKLLENFKDLRFDSVIFIFGFGKGEYLKKLLSLSCEKNNIFILEPDLNKFNEYKDTIKQKNVFLIYFDEKIMGDFLEQAINSRNFANMFIASYGNYEKQYKKEYEKFMELIDDRFFSEIVAVNTCRSFKKIWIKNLISNLDSLNNAYPISKYENKNKNIPALIVSGGPSLDKNIEDMLKNKDKLDKFLIIAGNRTLKPLLDNGIIPDLVVAVDPQEITYDMMKDYMDCKVPLVYFEQSNHKLLDNYKGLKIYTTQGTFQNVKELSNLPYCYLGGSVAHCSTDIAAYLGCNPIIFLGQDFGYTFNKHHAKASSLSIDSDFNKEDCIKVKDVFGEDMLTDKLLLLYKKNMEFYIDIQSNVANLEFINASYGANIMGAEHKELSQLLCEERFKKNKKPLKGGKKVVIDIESAKKDILDYINEAVEMCNENIYICNNIIRFNFNEAVEKFTKVLRDLDEFVKSPKNLHFKGYLGEFLFDIKEKYFKMKAQDYSVLTSNLVYQGKVFQCYFEDLKIMLLEVRDELEKCINE